MQILIDTGTNQRVSDKRPRSIFLPQSVSRPDTWINTHPHKDSLFMQANMLIKATTTTVVHFLYLYMTLE